MQLIDPVFQFEAEFSPSLFTIIYARFFLTSPSPKNESKTVKNPNSATGTFSSEPKAGYAFLLSLCKICCCAETSSSSCFVLSLRLACAAFTLLLWPFNLPALFRKRAFYTPKAFPHKLFVHFQARLLLKKSGSLMLRFVFDDYTFPEHLLHP